MVTNTSVVTDTRHGCLEQEGLTGKDKRSYSGVMEIYSRFFFLSVELLPFIFFNINLFILIGY